MILTVKKVFERYPLLISKMAERLDMKRETLSHMINHSIVNGKPRKANKWELKCIEDELHKIGKELQNLDLRA
jgi:hypothetical protein